MTEPRQKPGRSKQDYGTPPELLEAVKRKLGISAFVCDLAATSLNAVADRYCADAFAEASWAFGPGWNWLNPPYAQIAPWVARAHAELRQRAVRTAVLLPAAVGSNWWRDYVHQRCEVVFLNGRITFLGMPINPKTGRPDPYPKDCALLLYRPVIEQPYSVWTWRGERPVADANLLAGRTGQGDDNARHASASLWTGTD